MNIYIFMILGLSAVAIFNRFAKLHDKYTIGVMFIVLVLIAGLRYMVGTDYTAYILNYENYKTESLLEFNKLGVRIIAHISMLIKDDYATWFFMMSLFSVGLSIIAIYRYSDYAVLSVFMFVFLGCWHGSFNLVKQYGAVAVLLIGQETVLKRDFKKWIIICGIAAIFHISALFLIPIYFLVTAEVNKKHVLMLAVIGIAISFGYEYLFDIMSFLKEGESTTSIDSSVGSRQVNIIRVAVACAPPLLMYLYRNELDFTKGKICIWANISILNAVFYIAARNSVYLTRFCVYTDVFNAFLLPSVWMGIKRPNDRKLVIASCLLLYCCFWLYDLSKGSTTSVFQWIFDRNRGV